MGSISSEKYENEVNKSHNKPLSSLLLHNTYMTNMKDVGNLGEVGEKLRETLKFLSTHLDDFQKKGSRLLMTSSFQTQSVPLLHIISENFNEVEVLFIDTGFLFAETYAFKNELEKLFDLNVVVLESDSSYAQQRDSRGLFLYASDTDKCCRINKVEPLDNYLQAGDVWISGVRRDQTAVRKSKNFVETSADGIIRLHPMLNWTSKDIYKYLNYFSLPKHPLEFAGFESIGCVPCTHSCGSNGDRGGRWLGSKKTECGLHT